MFNGVSFRAAFLCLTVLLLSGLASAQQADCKAIYDKFLASNKGPEAAQYRTAFTTGKDFLDKCGSDPDQETVTAYITKRLPVITETIKALEPFERFNKAGLANNTDELVASGKELLARNHSASFDIMIVLATIGFNKATTSTTVNTANDDETLRYARTVLEKIGSGATSKTYGAYKYLYTTEACKDGAANVSGFMNYAIGSILTAQKKTQEALPYYYKATQNGCETKSISNIYRDIAYWYFDEEKKVYATQKEKLKASNDEETDEIKALDALRNGYIDRAIDAMSRAYKIDAANAKTSQAAKDSQYKKLQDIYGMRFGGKMDGFEQYLAKVSDAPFPDPTSAVKPVPSIPAAPADPVSVKPAATRPAKTATKTKAKKPARKTTKKKTSKK